MELWDLYTEDRQPTGKTHPRGEIMPEGLYHVLVQIWMRNGRGEYLITRRSPDKATYPDLWECPGGAVQAGEDSLTGALREAREEAGATLQPADGRLVLTRQRSAVGEKRLNDFLDVWVFPYEGEATLDNVLTPEEVCDIRWATRAEIEEMLRTGEFHPLAAYFAEDAGKEI